MTVIVVEGIKIKGLPVDQPHLNQSETRTGSLELIVCQRLTYWV